MSSALSEVNAKWSAYQFYYNAYLDMWVGHSLVLLNLDGTVSMTFATVSQLSAKVNTSPSVTSGYYHNPASSPPGSKGPSHSILLQKTYYHWAAD